MKEKRTFARHIIASTLWAIVNSLIKQGLSNDVTPMNFSKPALPLLELFFSLIPGTRYMTGIISTSIIIANTVWTAK